MEATRSFWNEEMESKLNTPEVRKIQLYKLKNLVHRVYDRNNYWKRQMDETGVRPKHIQSIDDFSRLVPVFDKAKRRKLSEEYNGDVIKVIEQTIATDLENIVLMAATSGTTGEPTPYPITRNDMVWFSENLSRVLWRIGVRPGSRLIHAFGLSMFLAGMPYAQFFERCGACVLPVGAEGGSEKILRFARMFQADTLACTPSLAEHMIDKAPEAIGMDVDKLALKRLLCGGEPGAGIPEVRQKLESAYKVKLFDTGAGFGISCDYPEYQGMHHIADDNILFELVDPDTYEPIPIENGAIGMPVQTTLEGEGFLWFRETIGDICQIFTDPCPCGQSGFRYRVTGRKDDMLKVKGVIVYPSAIDGVITGFVPQVTGEFRIVLNEPPPRVVPPLNLRVEYGRGMDESSLNQLEREIVAKMHSQLKVTPSIEWLAPDTLVRFAHKTKFIEKTYE